MYLLKNIYPILAIKPRLACFVAQLYVQDMLENLHVAFGNTTA